MYDKQEGFFEKQYSLQHFFGNVRTIKCLSNATLVWMPDDELENLNILMTSLNLSNVIPLVPSTSCRDVFMRDNKEFMIKKFQKLLGKTRITFSTDLLTLTNIEEFKTDTNRFIMAIAKEHLTCFKKVQINTQKDTYAGFANGLGVTMLIIPYWSLRSENQEICNTIDYLIPRWHRE